MSEAVQQDACVSGWPSIGPRIANAHPDATDFAVPREAAGDAWPGLAAAPHNARAALLARVVATEILPRLSLARGAVSRTVGADWVTEGAATGGRPVVAVTEADTAELVRLVLTEESACAIAFLENLRRRGVTTQALYLGIITQTAERVGDLWRDDRCDFVQVTISIGRLQQAVRALTPDFQSDAVRRPHADSLLLLPAPGEQHTLGLLMVGEFFRRAGWHVDGGPGSTGSEAAAMVRREWFDVAGFSLGSDALLDRLATCIRAVRRASRNRDLGVIVGGPLFLQQPALAARVGADTWAADAASAVQQAAGLLTLRVALD